MKINIKFPELPSEGLYFLDFADDLAAAITEEIEKLDSGDNVTSFEVVGMTKDSITLDVSISNF